MRWVHGTTLVVIERPPPGAESPNRLSNPRCQVSTELFATMIIVMATLGANSNASSNKIDGIDFLVDTSFRIWVMMIEVHRPRKRPQQP